MCVFVLNDLLETFWPFSGFDLLTRSVALFSCHTLPDCDPSLVGSATVAVAAVRKGFAAVVQ